MRHFTFQTDALKLFSVDLGEDCILVGDFKGNLTLLSMLQMQM